MNYPLNNILAKVRILLSQDRRSFKRIDESRIIDRYFSSLRYRINFSKAAKLHKKLYVRHDGN
ncbi:MAG: hypothetical protein ACJAUU_000038 [Rickettsiales bacterium]|jgi:hypothetical protein